MTRRIQPLRPVFDEDIRYGRLLSGGGLGDPIILYDTRNHDPSDFTTMPNEGTAGAVFDLDLINFGSGYWGIKRLGWYSQADTPGPFPLLFSDIGGHPCQAPFTFMVALPATITSTLSNCEVEWYWNAQTSDGHSLGYTAVLNYFDGPGLPAGFTGGYGRKFSDVSLDDSDGSYQEWFPDNESPLLQLGETLVVVHHDSINSRGRTWLVDASGESLVGTTDEADDSSYISDFPLSGSPPAQCLEDGRGLRVERMFWSLGYHASSISRSLGDPWSHVAGAALFRGASTTAERRTWYDYFL